MVAGVGIAQEQLTLHWWLCTSVAAHVAAVGRQKGSTAVVNNDFNIIAVSSGSGCVLPMPAGDLPAAVCWADTLSHILGALTCAGA